jgi:hypothetical protein
MMSIFITFQPGTAKPNEVIPTFVVVSVIPGVKVTIRTANFPANKDFTVTMGKNHTLGVGGIVVATTNSGAGGSFQATYDIPLSLKGEAIIAIRLQATTGKYYAYNWFANSSTPQSTAGIPYPTSSIPTQSGTQISLTPGAVVLTPYATLFHGYPYFGITGVLQDSKVSISGANFPLNKDFKILMGPYGSYGLGGTLAGSMNTGSSPVFNATYDIPASVKGLERIAIRMDSSDGSFYAYNWFFNRSTTGSAIVNNLTFAIQSIVADTSVTILTHNFPAKAEYEVLMGLYGTQGINGISVGKATSTTGGSFTATFNIPAGLIGQQRIAIRLVGKDGSFAYNWFYNVSAGT